MRSYSEALAVAESWSRPPFDNDTVTVVKTLLEKSEPDREHAIMDRFGYDLSFGTAGMRAIMDVGTARINEYIIARVSVAVAKVLRNTPHIPPVRGESGGYRPVVVLGYDGRKDSARFAKVAAAQFLAHGIDVHAFDRIVPTPVVPFAVRRLKADCGVMITSSHNAAAYNGYKVYNANGAQILSPFDTDVMAAMDKLPYAGGSSVVAGSPSGKLISLDEKLLKDYVEWVTSEVNFAADRSMKIVFTPLHGAAGALMNAVFYRSGFKNFLPVPQQYEPHPGFPSVKAPNPENKDSLDMAIEKAHADQADLILATDGDGDRIGIAYRKGDGFRVLTGNQIGTVLLFYLLSKMREKNIPLNGAFALSSVVSTPLTRAVCAHFGIEHYETLTGFKNMGNKAHDLMVADKNRRMVLAFEEAFGVTIGDSRDKDGIISCLLAAHCASDGGIEYWLKAMYDACGFFAEDAVEREFHGAEGIAEMANVVDKLRTAPPKDMLGSPITTIRDFKKGTETHNGVSKPIEGIPSQNLLFFINAQGDWVAVRPSGTEPKVKAYVGVRDKSAWSVDLENKCHERLVALCHFAKDLLDS